MPGALRAGHDPAPALGEQPDADLAAELVVDVVADPERQVQLLRLEPGDLAAKELERRRVVVARRVQELLVALVAAEDRVGQVEEDDRCLGERGERLVLEPALAMTSPAAAASTSSSVVTAPWVGASSMSGWPASDLLRMLARRYHDERCQKRLAAASASAWVASSRSSVAAQAGSGPGRRRPGSRPRCASG